MNAKLQAMTKRLESSNELTAGGGLEFNKVHPPNHTELILAL